MNDDPPGAPKVYLTNFAHGHVGVRRQRNGSSELQHQAQFEPPNELVDTHILSVVHGVARVVTRNRTHSGTTAAHPTPMSRPHVACSILLHRRPLCCSPCANRAYNPRRKREQEQHSRRRKEASEFLLQPQERRAPQRRDVDTAGPTVRILGVQHVVDVNGDLRQPLRK